MTNPDLDKRFRQFMDSRSWAECIDDLPVADDHAGVLKADYFIEGRDPIVEVKSAKKDMGPRFERALDPFMKDDDWPVFYGPTNIAPFLERHPRRDEIMPVLTKAVTKGLEDQIKKANRQIRETKESFGLADSQGLVVYLNDRTAVVPPDVIAMHVARMMGSKHADGRSRFSSIQAVLVMSETHYIDTGTASPAAPCVFVPRDGLASTSSARLGSDRIVTEWAQHNGSVLMNMTITELEELSNAQKLFSDLQNPSANQAKPMYQRWIDEYRANPHLTPLDDAGLIRLGADLLGRLGASFLKKTKYKPSKTEQMMQFRVFTCLLEELKVRGIGVDQIPRRHREHTMKIITDLSGVEVRTSSD